MLQLISSQLDMDRMDYLKRDSFIRCGRRNVNSERLIQMMNVVDDVLVMKKRIYSVEIFDVQTINVLASLFA
jgi:HD superfamily phosphohydrolase